MSTAVSGLVFQFVWIAMLLAGFGIWVAQRFFDSPVSFGRVLIPGGLVLALAGLILIEQLYRNSTASARWNIKTLALGLGGLFAYDLFLYSQGVLFGGIDEAVWSARGVVNILFVPLIAIAARRNEQWDLDIFVSRHVVFYTTTLVAVGVYLLLMSAGGYAILLYGGDWAGLLQVVFFVGAGLVLATLLFSNKLRARLKVFLSKHFFRNKYDYREEWLRLIATLAEFEDSSTRQIVIKALAQIVESRAACCGCATRPRASLRPASSSRPDFDVPAIPLDEPLALFIEKNHWLFDLEEYRRNPELYDNVPLPDWLAGSETAWLIVPLASRHYVLGLVLLDRADGPLKLNYEDRDLLKTVGHHLAVHLAQEHSDNLLAEAQQFEAYNRLTAFLMHDLNNLIAQQSLIVKNAERHKRNPEFVDDAMQTIASSVTRMKRVMTQLERREDAPKLKKTLLKFLISAAADRCAGRAPEPEIDIGESDIELEVDVDRFVMVLTHLIRNAQDATPAEGSVRVSARRENGRVEVTVADTGAGMTPEFIRDRLFRPFDSTKGSQGMGIGVYQAREFARSLGGDLKVRSAPGKGTTFVLAFPKHGVTCAARPARAAAAHGWHGAAVTGTDLIRR
ncbi:MAG: XrtA/PEP-CTERM system histidine kinase PrsK [Woeseiaceae bacterium]|nr:XrtA/PEP-CTERM system histidine kinase PrsK [Woeseiaceae bacterium]